jgi:hypothetical protein
VAKRIKVAVIISETPPQQINFYEGDSLRLKDGNDVVGDWAADAIASVDIFDDAPPGGGS